jgi:hypothetical protein
MDLAINIVYIFFCFSNFSQFHPFISQNRVGDTCMRLIDTEMERARNMDKEFENHKAECILKTTLASYSVLLNVPSRS